MEKIKSMEKYCIGCRQLVGHDGAGWESFHFPVGIGVNLRQMTILLCPNCIQIQKDTQDRDEFWTQEEAQQKKERDLDLEKSISMVIQDYGDELKNPDELVEKILDILKNFNIINQ